MTPALSELRKRGAETFKSRLFSPANRQAPNPLDYTSHAAITPVVQEEVETIGPVGEPGQVVVASGDVVGSLAAMATETRHQLGAGNARPNELVE